MRMEIAYKENTETITVLVENQQAYDKLINLLTKRNIVIDKENEIPPPKTIDDIKNEILEETDEKLSEAGIGLQFNEYEGTYSGSNTFTLPHNVQFIFDVTVDKLNSGVCATKVGKTIDPTNKKLVTIESGLLETGDKVHIVYTY
jgi:hypothetical protein